MTDFLLLLGKVNLALAASILAVCLLRRPVRNLFGAPLTYALWFLVPVAALASLLPPRTVASGLAPMSLIEHMPPATAAPPPTFDGSLPLFIAWALGVGVMALYLARLQARFHMAERMGEAGPAVAGFFRPRIVMPGNFQAQFTLSEQSLILAHERTHLARQDARINAVAALLRAVCWFNPLVHLGADWLRTDQELACDADVLGRNVSRRDYAQALLKSQIARTMLPLGCQWPGSEHPLAERIALLGRKRPTAARRFAGMAFVSLAVGFAGFSAWAAQPAAAAAPVAHAVKGLAPLQLKPIASTHVLPPYPEMSKRLGEQGTVTLSLTIGTGGNVTNARLEKSSGSQRLDQAALDSVRAHWLWQPPTRGGKPVVATTRVKARFALKAPTPQPNSR